MCGNGRSVCRACACYLFCLLDPRPDRLACWRVLITVTVADELHCVAHRPWARCCVATLCAMRQPSLSALAHAARSTRRSLHGEQRVSSLCSMRQPSATINPSADRQWQWHLPPVQRLSPLLHLLPARCGHCSIKQLTQLSAGTAQKRGQSLCMPLGWQQQQQLPSLQ
jgi:hypothetical protein